MVVQVMQKSLHQKKRGEDFPCGYSMSNIWAFDNIENKYNLYRR